MRSGRFAVAFLVLAGACSLEDADRVRTRPITVGVDATHANRHTLDGTYQAFGRVVEEPAVRVPEQVVVRSVTGSRITRPVLDELDVLVIAGPEEAVTRREVRVIDEWVHDGGALFLVIDHHPYPGAVLNLAEAFGVELFDGWLHNGLRASELELTLEDRSLRPHPLTEGPYGRVEHVFADAGAAYLVPEGAAVVGEVPVGWKMSLPDEGVTLDAAGMALITALEVGAGRVVINGEASMLTCQPGVHDPEALWGLCEPGREDQAALVGNAVHWLATGR